MMIVYQGSHAFLPLLACALHLGTRPGETLREGSRHDWRREPFRVIASTGDDLICCLVTGREREVYRRALEGTSALFGVSLIFRDTDAWASSGDWALRLARHMDRRLPRWLEERCRVALVRAILR